VTLTRLWPVAASTAVVVAVAVAAVAVLSHRPTSSAPARSGPVRSGRPLTGMLGVLRRPQTEADRQTWVPGFFTTFASPGCPGANTPFQCTLRLDRPLIRQAVVRGSGYRVGLLPYTSKGKIAGVAVTLRGLIVVPDGVARVVIGPVRLLDRSITSRVAPSPGATAVVHDNVALFQLHGLTLQKLELRTRGLARFFTQGSGRICQITSAIFRLPAVAHMLWLAPGGTVINHTLIRFPLYVGTHHPPPGTTRVDPLCGTPTG
jgi:hypothetical protein